MEELMSKLQQVLSTKEGQDQLKNLSSMFQNQNANQNNPTENTSQNNTSNFDISAISNMLSGMNNNSQQEQTSNNNGFDINMLTQMMSGMNNNSNNTSNETQSNTNDIFAGMDIAMIMKLVEAFQQTNVNDKNSNLLNALKPHFSDKKRSKVEQAITMMRIFSMWPVIKDSGILSKFLGKKT